MSPSETVTDEVLVARLKGSDESAHSVLFDRYAPRLLGYLVQRGIPREDAEDLLNEIFEEIIRRIDQFDPERGSLPQWIFTLAGWRARDYRRRQTAPAESPLEENTGAYEQRFPSLGAADPPDDRQVKLRQALYSLPDRYRTVLELRLIAGWTHRAIADSIGIGEGHARVLLGRAVEALKKRLSQYPEFAALLEAEQQTG